MVACKVCQAAFASLGEHAKHQRSHINSKNFKFSCGECNLNFSTYGGLDVHLSRAHRNLRREAPAPEHLLSCQVCNQMCSSVRQLCHHTVVRHMKQGEKVCCPLTAKCGSTTAFSEGSFRTHLSLYHKGWNALRNDEVPFQDFVLPVLNETPDYESLDGGDLSMSIDCTGSFNSDDSYFCFAKEEHDQKEELLHSIAMFYLKMETECLMPGSTVQTMCEGFANLLHQNLGIVKKRILKELEELKVVESDRQEIANSILNSDGLYAAHHKGHGRGPWLSTKALRLSFYKENYKYIEPLEVNLSRDTMNPRPIHYVSIIETLELMLACKSVQSEIDESFRREPIDGTLLQNYTDGSTYQNRQSSRQKTIDIFIFQDAFKPTTDLSSVALKHNTLGVYMTLGNLKPHTRSKLDALQLVMLVLNYKKIFKNEILRKKCFEVLLKDLKKLEVEGIVYKGEPIKVVLQFVIGDNLGQHEIGGYIGSFSSEFFCRYCPISRTEYGNEPWAVKPFITPLQYEEFKKTATALHSEDPKLVHYKGVKHDGFECPFNSLDNFHVSDPAMPPCVAHDLLCSGVIDRDLAHIIFELVSDDWFTYEHLDEGIDIFDYQTSDRANKPAPVRVYDTKKRVKEKKLGGHAVQNLTLLRLLPLLLTRAKIRDPTHPHWQLFLGLKEISEYIFAPAITLEQVAYLKALVENYLNERELLEFRQPKGHFLAHAADLFMIFGPLKDMSTMRFESLHSFFRKTARLSNNFINPGKTMAKKHSLYLAYLSAGKFFHHGITDPKGATPLCLDLTGDGDVLKLLTNQKFSQNALEVQSISVDDIEFRKNKWILLGRLDETLIHVGVIEAIILDQNSVTLLLQTFTADVLSDYGLYKIAEQTTSRICVQTSKLEYPCAHPVYNINRQNLLSLKGVLAHESKFF